MLKARCILLKNPKILKILLSAHVDSDGRKCFERKGEFQKYLIYSDHNKCKLYTKIQKYLKYLFQPILIQMEEKVLMGEGNSKNT